MSSAANDLALICRIPGRQLQIFSRATDDGLIYEIAKTIFLELAI